MKPRQASRLGDLFANGQRIDKTLKSAVRQAIRQHKAHDVPVVVWRDGRVAWVRADDLKQKQSSSRKPPGSP